MSQPRISVPTWVAAVVVAAIMISVGLIGVMTRVALSGAPASDAPYLALTGVVVLTIVVAVWTVQTPAVAVWARLAVVVTASQLGIAIAAWVLWRTIAPTVASMAVSFPLLEDLPAPAVALGLGAAVVAASMWPRRRRTGAPRWLHGVVVFGLAYLLLLAFWMPVVASQVPDSHTMVVDVRDWIGDLVAFVLIPPAALALGVAVVVEQRPPWLRQRRVQVSAFSSIFVFIALLVAIGARTDASAGSHFMYGNFVHVLFSVAAFALIALAALAWSHARALAANRDDSQRPAPWAQEGVVVVPPGGEPEVGHVIYHGLLGGLRPAVAGFVLRTPRGDLPVPAGVRLSAALPLSTESARAGERTAVLREGERVIVSGFVAPAADGPYRESSLLAAGPGGLVVAVPRHRAETISRDVLLLIWRPCVLFLVVAALAALPGILGSHAPYQEPDDLDQVIRQTHRR